MSAEDLEIKVKMPFLIRFRFWVNTFWNVALAVFVCGLGILAADLYTTLDARQRSVETKITASIDAASLKLSNSVDSKFEELRGDLKPVLKSAAKTLDASTTLLAHTTEKVDAVDVVSLNKTVAALGPALDGASAALKSTANSVATVTNPLSGSLNQIQEVLPDFLDCKVTADGIGNSTCLYRRYADLTQEADATMKAIAAAAPKTSAAVQGITEDSHAITADAKTLADRYSAPPTKWQKVQGFVELFVEIVIKTLVR